MGEEEGFPREKRRRKTRICRGSGRLSAKRQMKTSINEQKLASEKTAVMAMTGCITICFVIIQLNLTQSVGMELATKAYAAFKPKA